MIRSAISPRLAIKILLNTGYIQMLIECNELGRIDQEQRLIKFYRRRIIYQYFHDLSGIFRFDFIEQFHSFYYADCLAYLHRISHFYKGFSLWIWRITVFLQSISNRRRCKGCHLRSIAGQALLLSFARRIWSMSYSIGFEHCMCLRSKRTTWLRYS